MNQPTPEIDNPFATRWVRPGAIAYRFAGVQTADQVVARLGRQSWWGQIIGPHGSGKSTLLATLDPHLKAAGRRLLAYRLGAGMRRLPDSAALGSGLHRGVTLVIVDGYEQLGSLTRLRLKRAVRHADCGLLVTAHRSVGLPQLIEAHTDLRTVSEICAALVGDRPSAIGHEDLRASYRRCGGNVREILFDMYDFYERCRSAVRTDR